MEKIIKKLIKYYLSNIQAQQFINNNNSKFLANVIIKKLDTATVSILITKFQSCNGLITIGNVVDIYILSNRSSKIQSDSSSSNFEGDQSNSERNSIDNDNDTEENSENNNNKNMNSELKESSIAIIYSSTIGNSPDIRGSTILAIMSSKDSEVIYLDCIKSKTSINGNMFNQIEDINSFTADVEELIRGSISGGYNEKYISSLLDSYGLKLSDYKRKVSLGEIDIQYLLLIEVPRENLSHVINNIDNIILTILYWRNSWLDGSWAKTNIFRWLTTDKDIIYKEKWISN